MVELHKKVSIFRSNPDSDEMKEMILVITKEFGLLVRDKIDGIEILTPSIECQLKIVSWDDRHLW